jgi:hypothetical protein
MAGRHCNQNERLASEEGETPRRQRINKKKQRNETKKEDVWWRGVVGGCKKLDKKIENEIKDKGRGRSCYKGLERP